VLLTEFFEDFTGGGHATSVGGFEAAFDAGDHAVVFDLPLESGEFLFEGGDAGFEFGDGHKAAPVRLVSDDYIEWAGEMGWENPGGARGYVAGLAGEFAVGVFGGGGFGFEVGEGFEFGEDGVVVAAKFGEGGGRGEVAVGVAVLANEAHHFFVGGDIFGSEAGLKVFEPIFDMRLFAFGTSEKDLEAADFGFEFGDAGLESGVGHG
jgi:hypothetical protein